ncbi:hypothetical protein Aduo_018690 [Ancylostoma duodenale]
MDESENADSEDVITDPEETMAVDGPEDEDETLPPSFAQLAIASTVHVPAILKTIDNVLLSITDSRDYRRKNGEMPRKIPP